MNALCRQFKTRELNHAPKAKTCFFQIWIAHRSKGIYPGYEQRPFAEADMRGKLGLIATEKAADGADHPCRCGVVRLADAQQQHPD